MLTRPHDGGKNAIIANIKPSKLLANLRNESFMETLMDALKMNLWLEQHDASFNAAGRTRLELSIKSEWYKHIRLTTSSNTKLVNTTKGGPVDSCTSYHSKLLYTKHRCYCCCCFSHSGCCQPEKTTLHGGQSRSWFAEQGKYSKKRKSLVAHPPQTQVARSEKMKYKSRDASTCLGATQVSARLASSQGFLRLVD